MDHRAIAVTNLFDGVDWYDLVSQGLVDSVRTTIVDNVITPIISGSAGSLIIGGSCGAVQVLQPPPAIVVQTLGLEDGKLVQALAYTPKPNGRCLLVAGTSELGSRTTITIWRSEQDRSQIVTDRPKASMLLLQSLSGKVFVFSSAFLCLIWFLTTILY
ncbi:hypothetical protein BDM02DRAFT_3193488 [Thelephora ganbajun]|uniref:Uncharacterized protein n=1 Tax=Thelephora ganbajun TaxID=370292 RepID=A0ACB6YY03_THEGA|nr:hypothetical protein BDM02DRAFT_3193488 [Thelephora ganbajun]